MKNENYYKHMIINYKNLLRLAPTLLSLECGEAMKSIVTNYVDLNLDILEKTEEFIVIALSHYFKDSSGEMDLPHFNRH